jgi:hypothetical protein
MTFPSGRYALFFYPALVRRLVTIDSLLRRLRGRVPNPFMGTWSCTDDIERMSAHTTMLLAALCPGLAASSAMDPAAVRGGETEGLCVRADDRLAKDAASPLDRLA